MNIDWTLQLPSTIDIMHVLLAALAVLLFLGLLVKRNRNTVDAQRTSSVETQAEIDPKAQDAHVQNQKSVEAEEPTKPAPVNQPSKIKENRPESALQLLALLQKDARLVDFVQEDLTSYSDADVGSVARVVHEGAKKIINKYFSLSPIRSEEEESEMTVEKGFDPQLIRLTGNVVGEAPYKGVLLHRGWRAEAVQLPQIVEGHNSEVIAPAEVEL